MAKQAFLGVDIFQGKVVEIQGKEAEEEEVMRL
ncbi:MAG: hypothetical protein ACJAVK_003673 [Akkermansiaceae bacterium]|jgi:hypothetical protein